MSKYINKNIFPDMYDGYLFMVDDDYISLKRLRKFINAIPEADLPPTICRWIPCSERLPEEFQSCLVTVLVDGDYEVDSAISGGTYIDGYWDTHIDWDEGNNPHIIAWMPFPEPFKKNDEDRSIPSD